VREEQGVDFSKTSVVVQCANKILMDLFWSGRTSCEEKSGSVEYEIRVFCTRCAKALECVRPVSW